MTPWRQVHGSQETRPIEFDTTSSSVVVYHRKNIERVSFNNDDGSVTELWQYDERQMTREEYNEFRIIQNTADIDYISMVMNVKL